MFSGIIDHCGTINKIENRPNALRLTIDCKFSDFQLGESIAVDGICLTVTDHADTTFCCDLSSETLRLTTANEFQVGRQVNLERALRVGDRLGGHWVMGHVDQWGVVEKITQDQEFLKMQISGVAKDAMAFLLKKGSIAVNGV